ncbi:hatching enzyme 1.2-like [Alosa sapidissima]|uniref:hatching enzyme 1.2-like n=1 Tax=Alosa sapidissima TaxID=34773 RepID=UPI001C0A63A2|nr:hatching enzyme 1.2-like [Alosa sapidissima]
MDLRASLSLLVLLLGLCKGLAFMLVRDGVDIEKLIDDADNVDLTTQILSANNASGELLVEGDIAVPRQRNALICSSCKWKKSANGLVEVPVIVSPDFSVYERMKIEKAMLTFTKETCIRFVPRSTEVDYISIENGKGCWSYIGRAGGRQLVSLNRDECIYNGLIQHELNHALGFYHEHNRADRDQYVKVHWEYVDPDQAYNFRKQYGNTMGTPYDYTSVMHYTRTVFTTENGKATLTPIPDPDVPIGQIQGLSPTDILRIKKLYEC